MLGCVASKLPALTRTVEILNLSLWNSKSENQMRLERGGLESSDEEGGSDE